MGNIVYNATVRIVNIYKNKTKHLLALQPHFPTTFEWSGKQYRSDRSSTVIVEFEDYVLLSTATEVLFVSYLDGT